MADLFSKEQCQLLNAVDEVSRSLGVAVYAVGGIVRDLLRGEILCDRDLDFMVEGSAAHVAEQWVSRFGGECKTFPQFLTAKVVRSPQFVTIRELDFASARTESYAAPGRLPTVTAGQLGTDLQRRDFTINALALPLTGLIGWLAAAEPRPELSSLIIDQTSGLHDLSQRLVRVIHSRSFIDDPTRIFRGARYVARIEGAFEPSTETLLRSAIASGALDTISPERIVNEIRKVVAEPKALVVADALQAIGVWEAIGWLHSAHSWDSVRRFLSGIGELTPRGESGAWVWDLWNVAFYRVLKDDQPFLKAGLGKKRIARWRNALEEPLAPNGATGPVSLGELVGYLQSEDQERRAAARDLLLQRGVLAP